MRALRSLSNRLFLVCVLLSIASIGGAMLFVSARLTREHDHAMAQRLDETITLVERQRRALLDTSTRLARLVADLPKLKAALSTGDAPTVSPIVASYRDEIGADVLIISDATGAPVFTAGDARGDVATRRLAIDRTAPRPTATLATMAHPRGILQLVSVPVVIGVDPVENLGLLSVGMLLDDRQARDLRASTGSELAFAMGSNVLASSIGPAAASALAPVLDRDAGTIQIGRTRYAWHRYALQPMAGELADGRGEPRLVVLHSTDEADATLRSVRIALAVIALLTALAASVASYAVARTITRPLSALTTSMREMARTGMLTQQPPRALTRVWDDEDVRTLAGTFDAMTQAIGRFQQQAADRDRLTALGRLSTVIAHEIRNPLMIVRGALRGLRQQDDPDGRRRRGGYRGTGPASRSRGERGARFRAARAPRCRTGVAARGLPAGRRACVAAETEPPVTLTLDDAADAVQTDADRLRAVLVNLIANAREAVRAAARPPGAAWSPSARDVHPEPS